jgi:hypothetical protein
MLYSCAKETSTQKQPVETIPTELRMIEKPANNLPIHPAFTQAPSPQKDKWREIPYNETNAAPELTASEKERGFLLFSRPITEIVYPNTQPLAHERIEGLRSFGTPGEFEPVTFSIYPNRDLKNLKVRVSDLSNNNKKTISASTISVRLLTYWNVRYPHYQSKDTYRRVPELLEPVTAHSSPAGECQRYWLTFKVPEDAAPGLYHGTVSVWDDISAKATSIPLSFKVFPFKLKKDPRKHFTAFYYDLHRNLRNKDISENDKAIIEKTAQREYQIMREYGFDTIPAFDISYDKKTNKFYLPDWVKMGICGCIAAGMKGPLVFHTTGINDLYQKHTGQRIKGHGCAPVMPNEDFFRELTRLIAEIDADIKQENWPKACYMPMDEISSEAVAFGTKCYKAFKAAGVATWGTKDPCSSDASAYAPFLENWCAQPYSMPYEKVISDSQHEYWCYPNHNACERRVPAIMCKGGRMTYGYGFWRSGYTRLMPWIWRWRQPGNNFDYLKQTNCGLQISANGEIFIPAYWECFREGYDDSRYLYTLQSTIVEREYSDNPACKKLVREAKEFLRYAWERINVQPLYLDKQMWLSEEFDNLRWRMASYTEKLKQFTGDEKQIAPSVLPDVTQKTAPTSSKVTDKNENVEKYDLGYDNFKAWTSCTQEGKTAIIDKDGVKSLQYNILVDHQLDGGGEEGKYPVGWPRVRGEFSAKPADFTQYDYLHMKVWIDSSRDEVADDHTPAYLTFSSAFKGELSAYTSSLDVLGAVSQRTWLTVSVPIADLVGENAKPWTKIDGMQFGIREREYMHKDRLTFIIKDICLVRNKQPAIEEILFPETILLPRQKYSFQTKILGIRKSSQAQYSVSTKLSALGGKLYNNTTTSLEMADMITLDTSSLKPGKYMLQVMIMDMNGEVVSIVTKNILAELF